MNHGRTFPGKDAVMRNERRVGRGVAALPELAAKQSRRIARVPGACLEIDDQTNFFPRTDA